MFARESVFVFGRQLQLESRSSVELLSWTANLVRLWAVFVEFWFFVDSSFTIRLECFPYSPFVIEQQQAGELKGNFCNFAFPGRPPGWPVQWRFSGKRNTRSDKMTTDQWIKFLFRNTAWPKKEGVCQQNHFGVALNSLKEGWCLLFGGFGHLLNVIMTFAWAWLNRGGAI